MLILPPQEVLYKLHLKVIGLIVQGGHECMLRNLENAQIDNLRSKFKMRGQIGNL